jgi:hypothetical protein
VLEVQNPTKAIKSVKDPDNIFELTPKWASTLPFVGIFHVIFIESRPHLGFKSKVFKSKDWKII